MWGLEWVDKVIGFWSWEVWGKAWGGSRFA